MYLKKRYNRWWAFHDIPKSVRAVLGNRFSKNLLTSDPKVARIRAVFCESQWLLEIERAKDRSPANVDSDALYWKAELESAPEEWKEGIRDHIAGIAQEMVHKAASNAGIILRDEEEHEEYLELPEQAAAERFVGIATGKIIGLTDHLDEYLATLKSAETKTVDMRRSTITKFGTTFPYLSDVKRKDVQRWINDLGAAGKKPATIQRALSELRGYWAYLQSIEAISDSVLPFEKLTIPKAGKAEKQDERKPFKADEVVALWATAKDRKDTLADLIELAMWSGARIEELCALPVTKAKDGILEIEDAKTAAGWRQIPIHSKLTATVARLIKESKDGFLLCGLSPNKYGDRSNALGKRFGHLKKAQGFGPNHVFHSIRKTVATLFENAGVPEGVSADILGHDKPTMTYGHYSGGASLETKRNAIEKLSYPPLPTTT